MVAEAPHIAEFGRFGVVGDEAEGAADICGAELGVVADEQEFGAGLVGFAGESREFHGAGHRGFVDDDELVPAELPSVTFGVRARRALRRSAGDVGGGRPVRRLSRLFELADPPVALIGGDANGLVDPLGDVVRRKTEGVGQYCCGGG